MARYAQTYVCVSCLKCANDDNDASFAQRINVRSRTTATFTHLHSICLHMHSVHTHTSAWFLYCQMHLSIYLLSRCTYTCADSCVLTLTNLLQRHAYTCRYSCMLCPCAHQSTCVSHFSTVNGQIDHVHLIEITFQIRTRHRPT